MLKITLHDSAQAITFKLEGKLIGPWVKEFEQSWRTAMSILKSKALIIDLSQVSFIDQDGKRLIQEIGTHEARFIACAPMTRAVIEELTGRAPEHPPDSKKKFAGLFVLAFCSLLPAGRAAAQDAAPVRLTLHDAVNIALKQNPQVAIANLNIAESEQNRLIAQSSLLPQIGFEGRDLLQRANLAALIGRPLPGFPGHVGPFNMVQGGVGGTMPVFDLTLWRRLKASREGVQAAQAQEKTVREQNVLLVVSQYLGGLRASADVNAARSRAALAQALYDLAADLQKNGVGTRIDTLRAQVQLQNEKQRVIAAETQQKTSLFGLSRLLSLDPHKTLELADSVSFFETPVFSADNSIESAYGSRPEVKALEARMRGLDLEKQAARDTRLPKIAVRAAWALQGLQPSTAIPVYQYQATLDVPIFTGGRIEAELAKSDLELRKIAREDRELRNRIALEVKTAVEQLSSARSEVDVANLTVKLAAEEVTQARDRFQAGVTNNIEVITAQDELSRANDNQIVALYRYNQARADLAAATGQIEALYAK